MYEVIMAMILAIAAETGLPPNFVLAIAKAEDEALTVSLINRQVSDWNQRESYTRTSIEHIGWIVNHRRITTYWHAAVVYSAGIDRLRDPPASALRYADRVMALWHELEGVRYLNPVIGGKR